MSQTSQTTKRKLPAGITTKERELIDSLIDQRSGTPQRVTQELQRVHEGLKALVEAKVPIRDILNVFIKNLETRVTSAQARQYLREQFDYPPQRSGLRGRQPAKAASPKASAGVKKPSAKAQR